MLTRFSPHGWWDVEFCFGPHWYQWMIVVSIQLLSEGN
jgi:hypothetical protein